MVLPSGCGSNFNNRLDVAQKMNLEPFPAFPFPIDLSIGRVRANVRNERKLQNLSPDHKRPLDLEISTLNESEIHVD